MRWQNTPPPTHQRATVTLASGNDFARELLGGAASNLVSVRCPSLSLGVLIKPHETNEARSCSPSLSIAFTQHT